MKCFESIYFQPLFIAESRGGRWNDEEELIIEKALSEFIRVYKLPSDDVCVQAMKLHPILR